MCLDGNIMRNKKIIASLGDIHGRDRWMFHTHGSPYEFQSWRISVENGAPGNDEFWKDLPYMKYDKIIFVGDYTDSFNLSNPTILKNLQDIIFFKKVMPNKVVLLLGNHDIQYLVKNEICSGYRSDMSIDLQELLSDKDAAGNYKLIDKVTLEEAEEGELIEIYKDGVFSNETTLTEIRTTLEKQIKF